MVHSLIYLAFRRNINLSTKTFYHAEYLLRRRMPIKILTFSHYSLNSGDSRENDGTRKRESKLKPSSVSGKNHLNYVIEQAKSGKISFDDLKALAGRIIIEGQFKNYTEAPQVVQYIGFAGLLPMMGLPLMTLLSGHAFSPIVFCHLTYGATILSFLGGSNWYNAISKNEISYERLGWAVMPQVIGWMSLMLPLPLGILCTTFGFCLSLTHDILLTDYPQWMKSLRLILTAGTVFSLILMFLLCLIL